LIQNISFKEKKQLAIEVEDKQREIDLLHKQLQEFQQQIELDHQQNQQEFNQKCVQNQILEEQVQSSQLEVSTMKEAHVSYFIFDHCLFGMKFIFTFLNFSNNRFF
jgi:predicted RNase H-like nuclease (RuvC/YqgF family)